MARARVQGRGVASVSRAGRVRGVAARRRRTSIFSHVDFFVVVVVGGALEVEWRVGGQHVVVSWV